MINKLGWVVQNKDAREQILLMPVPTIQKTREQILEEIEISFENDVKKIVDHMNTCACENPVSVDHFKSLICSPCVAEIKMKSPFQDMQPMPATTTCNKEDGDSDGDDDDDDYDSEGDDDCEVSDNDDGGLHHTAVQLSCRHDKAPTPSSIQEHARGCSSSQSNILHMKTFNFEPDDEAITTFNKAYDEAFANNPYLQRCLCNDIH